MHFGMAKPQTEPSRTAEQRVKGRPSATWLFCVATLGSLGVPAEVAWAQDANPTGQNTAADGNSDQGSNSDQGAWGEIKIKATGGAVTGRLLSKDFKDPDSGKLCYVIETEAGARIQFDRSLVSWQPWDDANVQYRQRATSISDTAEAHWEMVKWCRETSSHKLKTAIEFHLLEVLRRDPGHAEAAKELTKLGWTQVNQQWLPEAQFLQSYGYVKVGNRPIPKIQLEINSILEQQSAAADRHKKTLNTWLSQVRQQRYSSDAEAIRAVVQNVDVVAVPEMDARAKKEDNAGLRRLYMEAIGFFPSPAAQNALVRFLLEDSEPAIRERALAILLQPDFDQGDATRFRAVSLIVGSGALNPQVMKDNERLQEAAAAIGELGTLNGVLPLIGSITTQHRVKTGNDPNRMNVANGNTGSGLGLGGGPAEVDVTINNAKVKSALRKITGVNAGDTPELWRKWYVDNFTLQRYAINRDE